MKTRNGIGGSHIGLFGRSLMLMGPNKDPKGGGGSGDPEDPPEDDEFEKKFETSFNKLFHKAMGERDKRLETKLTKNMETLLGGKMDEIKTLLSKEDDGGGGDPGKKDPPAKEGEFKLPPEIAARLAQAERDAKEAKAEQMKWKQQAEKEAAERSRGEEKTQLQQLLAQGVKPALLEMVVGQLHGRVKRDEEDSSKILFVGDDGQLLPLKDGVTGWLKSDAGKEVAPPRNAGGSGGTGPQGNGGKDPKNFGLTEVGDIVAGTLR